MQVKHSKIRNTGLLFEFIMRQITADTLNKKNKSKAVEIVKEFFNERTELGKELSLYNNLINKRFKADRQAEYFINEVISSRHNLNSTQLKREKYNLIKKLKEAYNLQDFLSAKINNYKFYASVYKLFEFKKLNAEQKTESFFNLVEHITTENNSIKLSSIKEHQLPEDEDLRILTYKTLLEKFNSKYTKLSLPQKSLLRAYINNVSGTNSLKEYIEKIVPALKREIRKYSKNLQDEVVIIKLNEAVSSIDDFCKPNTKVVNDKVVIQTMRYLELLKELKKSGKSNKKLIK